MTAPFVLNNGVELPPLGFGVFQTPPDETVAAVRKALEVGYRHIDTAAAYQNEREVGEAIRHSGVPREEIFVETKVWVSDYGYDETLHAFEKSSKKLGVDQIDLFILHQANPSIFDKTLGSYRALEHLLEQGSVRAIGISNFDAKRIDDLLEIATIVPAVNQIEVHPYALNRALQEKNTSHGILTQAWAPIGGIRHYNGNASPLTDGVIAAIAADHGKTPVQVMLRWHIQQGRSAIPKSTNPARIAQNFEVFDFALTANELERIDALDQGPTMNPAEMDFTGYGLEIPEA